MQIPVLMLSLLFTSCATTQFYVVRHAEKDAAAGDAMTTDVPLSAAGAQRAIALKDALKDKKIGTIYSTPTHRTTGTARPLSNETGVAIQIYNPTDARFLPQLRKHKGAPVLVVGHSNTVDDIINGLAGKQLLQDLPDSQYGDLFLLKIKGDKAQLEKKRFGN